MLNGTGCSRTSKYVLNTAYHILYVGTSVIVISMVGWVLSVLNTLRREGY